MPCMARHGAAMEINAAGLRWTFREFYPCSKIPGLACEIGVEITFGSDVHCLDDLASGFEEAEKWARRHAYDHYLVFIDRKAQAF